MDTNAVLCSTTFSQSWQERIRSHAMYTVMRTIHIVMSRVYYTQPHLKDVLLRNQLSLIQRNSNMIHGCTQYVKFGQNYNQEWIRKSIIMQLWYTVWLLHDIVQCAWVVSQTVYLRPSYRVVASKIFRVSFCLLSDSVVFLQATLPAASFQHPSGPDVAVWLQNYPVFTRESIE